MRDTLNTLLPLILRDPYLHASWLNTFSYLEYIGFRKIVKSQCASLLSAETLAHALEEGRHALRLKKLALKIGGKKFDRYDDTTLLCQWEAENYFQTLDRHCETEFSQKEPSQRARLTYLYVTWLVEIRALTVYQTYQALLPENTEVNLSCLLAEETKHLSAVESELQKNDPLFASRKQALRVVELRLYQDYLFALKQKLLSPRHENARRA